MISKEDKGKISSFLKDIQKADSDRFFDIVDEDDLLQILNRYFDMIKDFNQLYNIVGGSTIVDFETFLTRHFLDSAQICLDIIKRRKALIDSSQPRIKICDIGTGAGFPGIVIKIILKNIDIILIEKSSVKCGFLQSVKGEFGFEDSCRILNKNLSELNIQAENISLFTARAFKSLRYMLSIFEKQNINKAKFILLKGKVFKDELNDARKDFEFSIDTRQSIVHKDGVVCFVYNVRLKTQHSLF